MLGMAEKVFFCRRNTLANFSVASEMKKEVWNDFDQTINDCINVADECVCAVTQLLPALYEFNLQVCPQNLSILRINFDKVVCLGLYYVQCSIPSEIKPQSFETKAENGTKCIKLRIFSIWIRILSEYFLKTIFAKIFVWANSHLSLDKNRWPVYSLRYG